MLYLEISSRGGSVLIFGLPNLQGGGGYCQHNLPLGIRLLGHIHNVRKVVPLPLLVGCVLYLCCCYPSVTRSKWVEGGPTVSTRCWHICVS